MSSKYDGLIKLLNYFDEIGGFWSIDRSEEDNLSIEWSPFVGKNGKMVPKIYQKRVYDLDQFYLKCVEEVTEG